MEQLLVKEGRGYGDKEGVALRQGLGSASGDIGNNTLKLFTELKNPQ